MRLSHMRYIASRRLTGDFIMFIKKLSLKDQIRLEFDKMSLISGKGNPNRWSRATLNLAVKLNDRHDITHAIIVSGGRRRVLLYTFKHPIPVSHWSGMSTASAVESWTTSQERILVPIGSPVQLVIDFINAK